MYIKIAFLNNAKLYIEQYFNPALNLLNIYCLNFENISPKLCLNQKKRKKMLKKIKPY